MFIYYVPYKAPHCPLPHFSPFPVYMPLRLSNHLPPCLLFTVYSFCYCIIVSFFFLRCGARVWYIVRSYVGSSSISTNTSINPQALTPLPIIMDKSRFFRIASANFDFSILFFFFRKWNILGLKKKKNKNKKIYIFFFLLYNI